MKDKVIYIAILSIFAIIFSQSAVADDSIPDRILKEVTVKGERAWIEDGVMNFIPTKSEKRLSNSPASLIGAMHLPMLSGKDGIITNMFGTEVPIFINGVKAENIDIATFLTSDVKRVQYMEHPSESNYEGLPAVVNFIVSEYEFGGVSRAEIRQEMPNNGFYNAASKFVYKRMTYGALVDVRYTRDHLKSSNTTTKYNNLFYNDKFYDEITNNEETKSYNRNNWAILSLNAKYSVEKFRATHTFSLGWDRTPGSGSTSINEWSENLFNSNSSESYRSSKSLTPTISGKYWTEFSDKWAMSGTWNFKHSHNSSYSTNRMGLTNPIENQFKEDVSSINMSLKPSFSPSEKWVFQLKAQASLDWFASKYAGSANVSQNQKRQQLKSSVVGYWEPRSNLGINIEPGFLLTAWQIGSLNNNDLYPTVNTSIYWAPLRKLYFSGSLDFYLLPTSAFESNPVLVQNSELMWAKGNPYLNNQKTYLFSLYSTWLTNDWLTVSLISTFFRNENQVIDTYTTSSSDNGGLIKELSNADSEDIFHTSLNIKSSLFDRNLSLSIMPKWYHIKARGMYNQDFNHLGVNASVDYTLGNCNFGATYISPFKNLEAAGSELYWRQGRWIFSFTYGIDNFHLSIDVDNIFNSKSKWWRESSYSNYYNNSNFSGRGRCAIISLTYTIGYGKKIDRNIDIDTDTSTSSSIMDTKNK